MKGPVGIRPQSWRTNDKDVAYYDAHAPAYANFSLGIDFSAIHDRFLKWVTPGGLILDVGSGSGRDTLAFVRRGYRVEAIEPSAELASLSYRLTGIQPRLTRVQDLEDEDRFDGIWACASLVHVASHELRDAIRRLAVAARQNAPVYMSFKYGSGERFAADGRPYIDMNEEALHALSPRVLGLEIIETWTSAGEGIAYGRDQWFNAIMRRS